MYIYVNISLSSLLRTRNVSDKSRREIQNTCFMFNNIFLFEIRAVCEILCKNIVKPGRQAQMTKWRMSIACLITKATNTHSKYVIFIAFSLQKWLPARASMLYYSYISCLECECFQILQGNDTIPQLKSFHPAPLQDCNGLIYSS